MHLDKKNCDRTSIKILVKFMIVKYIPPLMT